MKKNFLLCVFFLCFSTFVFAEQQELRVAFSPLEGFFGYDDDGREAGYGVTLLKKISEYTNYKFVYVPVETWEDTKVALIENRADIRMPGTLPSKPSSILVYSNESIMDSYHAVMALKSREDLFYKDTDKFHEMKFAIVDSMLNNTDIKDDLDLLGITNKNFVQFKNYDECKAALEKGEVDALISNIMDLSDNMKILARFSYVPNYISMRIDDSRIKIINEALNEIKMDDPSFLPMLYNSCYPERSAKPKTHEEADFINQEKVLKVGMLPNRMPFSTYNSKTDVLTGINKDFMEWVSKTTGLKFEFIVLNQNEKAFEAVLSGKVDMVAGTMKTRQFEANPDLTLTEPFIKTSLSIVKRKDYIYNPKEPQIVSIPKSFVGLKDFVAHKYPNYELKFENSSEDCLQSLMDESADIMVQNAYVMDYMLQKPKFSELEVLPNSFVEEEDCIMLPSSASSTLVSLLNQAIKSVSSETMEEIIFLNTSSKPYQFTLDDILFKYKMPLFTGLVSIFVLIMLLSLIIIIRRRNELLIEKKNVELKDAYNQAQIASIAKSDFLARMSHEIRTPMNAIIGMTTIAKDHIAEPEHISQDLEKIDVSSKILLTIINDVLDMSAIESGKLKIGKSPFDFKQIVSSLTTIYYSQCSNKGINFQASLKGDVPDWMIGDQLRVNQILLNLLSNAVKFTDSGSVKLLIEQRNIEKDNIFMRFVISDTGCGMSKEMLDRLGQPFEQENAKTALIHGGSGLGISIVKNLVALMGGAMTVESELNKGSVFTVDLPFTKMKADSSKKMRIEEIRVLLADDERDSRDFAEASLSRINVRHKIVSSGKEAIEAIRKANADEDPFTVCIFDWKMPEMDGLELTRRIRKEFGDKTSIIVASAYDQSVVTEESKLAGANRFISKPIDFKNLTDTLQRFLEKKETN